ncbi:hypothetical protein TNCT_586211 [Trichonephila clavata]|uniref:Uncharacterized protein n=1 Tax=Trichonephila clavata TaxID=2740835 RepID=A0A8X6FFM1_TRICU|nr:hypothetical protein TNCT_586211 [Trichonephila clavata]
MWRFGSAFTIVSDVRGTFGSSSDVTWGKWDLNRSSPDRARKERQISAYDMPYAAYARTRRDNRRDTPALASQNAGDGSMICRYVARQLGGRHSTRRHTPVRHAARRYTLPRTHPALNATPPSLSNAVRRRRRRVAVATIYASPDAQTAAAYHRRECADPATVRDIQQRWSGSHAMAAR